MRRAAGELVRATVRIRRTSLRSTQHRRRNDDEADQRHDRILHHHHGDQADERQQIAADRRDQQIEHLRGGVRAGRQPRDEFGGMPVGEEADILVE